MYISKDNKDFFKKKNEWSTIKDRLLGCYTTITFNEDSDLIDVITFNTSLKNRLTEFAEKYPEECRITDRDDNGSISCEIRKGRMSFKLSAPYSEDRRKKASDLAKQHTHRLRNQKI